MSDDIVTRVHLDRADGRITVERAQDVQSILDANRALQGEAQNPKSDMRHIGTIPNVIIEKWITEEGAPVLRMTGPDFDRFIRKKLDDPDWRHLRTDK